MKNFIGKMRFCVNTSKFLKTLLICICLVTLVLIVSCTAKEPSTDVTKEPTVDIAEEPSTDVTKEPTVNIAEEPSIDVAKQLLKDALQLKEILLSFGFTLSSNVIHGDEIADTYTEVLDNIYNIHTVEDFENFVSSVYTEDAWNKLWDREYPFFKEIDGKLYIHGDGPSTNNPYTIYDWESVEQNENGEILYPVVFNMTWKNSVRLFKNKIIKEGDTFVLSNALTEVEVNITESEQLELIARSKAQEILQRRGMNRVLTFDGEVDGEYTSLRHSNDEDSEYYNLRSITNYLTSATEETLDFVENYFIEKDGKLWAKDLDFLRKKFDRVYLTETLQVSEATETSAKVKVQYEDGLGNKEWLDFMIYVDENGWSWSADVLI